MLNIYYFKRTLIIISISLWTIGWGMALEKPGMYKIITTNEKSTDFLFGNVVIKPKKSVYGETNAAGFMKAIDYVLSSARDPKAARKHIAMETFKDEPISYHIHSFNRKTKEYVTSHILICLKGKCATLKNPFPEYEGFIQVTYYDSFAIPIDQAIGTLLEDQTITQSVNSTLANNK